MHLLVTITDERSGAAFAHRARLCDSVLSRFCGLMLQAKLPEGEGIVLSPCNSVHMALMRFAIDVVYLDKEDRITKIVRGLKPYRISFGGYRAHSAIELPIGTLAGMDAKPGDHVLMVTCEGAREVSEGA